MTSLANQLVLVTGGSGGIGRAIARSFLESGARVAICGRSEEKLRSTAAELQGGARLYFEAADVADPDQVEALVRRIVLWGGAVDILVNNAGINIKERRFRELDTSRWQRVLRTNLDSAFYCTQAVLPSMRERGKGLVIFISSTAGLRPGPLGGAAYAASKFGMRAMGLCLGAEEEAAGVRVSVIYPGEVDTPLLDERPVAPTPEHRRTLLAPEDVAGAVHFVASLPPRACVPELVIKPASQVFF